MKSVDDDLIRTRLPPLRAPPFSLNAIITAQHWWLRRLISSPSQRARNALSLSPLLLFDFFPSLSNPIQKRIRFIIVLLTRLVLNRSCGLSCPRRYLQFAVLVTAPQGEYLNTANNLMASYERV